MMEEKRKFQRYIVKGHAMAILAPNSILPYQIIDISQHGLAFQYSGPEEWSTDLLEMKIIEGDDCLIDNLPARVVSNVATEEGLNRLRRCGVQFGELTPGQRAQLDYFIQEHTVGVS